MLGGLSCDVRPTNTQQPGATTQGSAGEFDEQNWMVDLVNLSCRIQAESL